MGVYIPDEAVRNKENIEKINAILAKVPETSIRVKGAYTLDDAVRDLRELGEPEIADLIG